MTAQAQPVDHPPADLRPLSARLWASGAPVYREILDHPFLRELSSGALDPECFRYYVVQDCHYLRDYARALSVLAARAPDRTTTAMFARHAAGAVAVEQDLHESALGELAPHPADREPPSPTTVGYTSYVLATVSTGSFADGLAAVLPCYWVYWEVGKALAAASSPDPLYARWIDTYAGEQFGEIVRPVLQLTDVVGAGLPAGGVERMINYYQTAIRFEWMFWDAAHRRERWPV